MIWSYIRPYLSHDTIETVITFFFLVGQLAFVLYCVWHHDKPII